ncbi:division/cell wall cluster transcriptional repressor MraZ [Paraburkholderia phosphatilytica]|uniref:division/cell wall cluster transcriptional repressor MraZ n=1 Tax=Paraburkholderia phosphatilytica TaxID=2282883 RepID=UPI000E4E846B|nr:division/cell wall cluster transcriptional repressor MraZ [Paraburkholderia phosphatilytica]
MFQGASALTLDAKGRMSIPSRYRDALQAQAEGRVTLTKHPDGCLLLFPRPEWEDFRERIMGLTMDAKWAQRIFLGSAADVELDSAGRVLVAPELREAAGLAKDVMLLGMGKRFELWNAQTYKQQEAAAMQQGLPDSLKNFII